MLLYCLGWPFIFEACFVENTRLTSVDRLWASNHGYFTEMASVVSVTKLWDLENNCFLAVIGYLSTVEIHVRNSSDDHAMPSATINSSQAADGVAFCVTRSSAAVVLNVHNKRAQQGRITITCANSVFRHVKNCKDIFSTTRVKNYLN